MKKLKALLLAGMLSSSLYAGNIYIGAGVMSGSGTQTLDYNGNSYDSDYDMSGGSVKFGAIYNNGNRLEIALNQFDVSFDNGGDDTYTGIDINYLITFMPKEAINPYIGLGVGYYESDNMTGYNVDTNEVENAQAVSLGASVGVLFSISNFEIEVAYQYRYLKWDYTDFDLYDNITNAYVGANIKF